MSTQRVVADKQREAITGLATEDKTRQPARAAESSAWEEQASEQSAASELGVERAPIGHTVQQLSVVRPQARLAVSQPSDPAEFEAEAIADRVMRMGSPEAAGAEPGSAAGPRTGGGPTVHRAATEPAVAEDASSTVQKGIAGGGQALDEQTRAFMEPRFGHDFSQVRVHTDAQATESAQAMRAHAYTVGRDIVFGNGQYAPGTQQGLHLLAHELTHVVQQTGGTASRAVVQRDAAPEAPKEEENAPPQPEKSASPEAEKDAPANTAAEQATPANTPSPNVSTDWFIDYFHLPMSGQGAKPKARLGNTALYVDDLKIFPDKARKPLEKLKGVNAATSGKVFLGSRSHPAGKSGTLSAALRFGKKPDLNFALNLTQNTKNKGKYAAEQVELKKQLKGALAEKLDDLERETGNVAEMEAELQKTAQEQLPAADDERGYSVKVSLGVDKAKAGVAQTIFEGIPYPAAKEGASYDVTVIVPVDKSEMTYGSKESTKDSGSKTKSSGTTTGESSKTAISTTDSEKILKGVKDSAANALKKAWQKQKTSVKSTKQLSEQVSKEGISAELGAKLALKLVTKELPLPLVGKIPLVRKLVNLLLKVEAEANGELTGKIGGTLAWEQKSATEEALQITDSELESLDSTVTKAIETFVNTEVQRSITEAIEKTYSVQNSEGESSTTGHETSKETSVSGKKLRYETGEPQLKVTQQ